MSEVNIDLGNKGNSYTYKTYSRSPLSIGRLYNPQGAQNFTQIIEVLKAYNAMPLFPAQYELTPLKGEIRFMEKPYVQFTVEKGKYPPAKVVQLCGYLSDRLNRKAGYRFPSSNNLIGESSGRLFPGEDMRKLPQWAATIGKPYGANQILIVSQSATLMTDLASGGADINIGAGLILGPTERLLGSSIGGMAGHTSSVLAAYAGNFNIYFIHSEVPLGNDIYYFINPTEQKTEQKESKPTIDSKKAISRN